MVRRIAGDTMRVAGFHVRNADIHVVVVKQGWNASDSSEVLLAGVTGPSIDDDVN